MKFTSVASVLVLAPNAKRIFYLIMDERTMCVGTHFHEPKKESKADFLDKLMLKACKEPMYGQPRRPRRVSLPFPCKRYTMLIVMRKAITRLS